MLCCYNSEKYLEETLNSIIFQTYDNWEIIAINDGSNDNTEKILDKYIKSDISIIKYNQVNKGFAAARNKALELAKGDWIAIIDHDDIWLPDKLENQTIQINNSNAKLFVSDALHIDHNGNKLRRHFQNIEIKVNQLNKIDMTNFYLKNLNMIATCTVIFEKESSRDIGFFDTSLKYLVDVDYFLRFSEKFNIHVSTLIMSKWRYHSESATNFLSDKFRLNEGNILIKKYFFKKNTYFSTKIRLIIIFFKRYIALYIKNYI